MFNHLTSSASQSFFGRIIAGFKGLQYLRVLVDENSAFFGGKDAPTYIKATDGPITTADYAYVIADVDSTFTTLADSEGENMLTGNYLGSFVAATTLKELRIIRAKKDRKIKSVTMATGAVWGIK